MAVYKDVLSELVGMFAGDARLSASILANVAAAAGTTSIESVDPLLGGGILLGGCLLLLIGAVYTTARRHWAVQVAGFRCGELDELHDDTGVTKDAADEASRRLD